MAGVHVFDKQFGNSSKPVKYLFFNLPIILRISQEKVSETNIVSKNFRETSDVEFCGWKPLVRLAAILEKYWLKRQTIVVNASDKIEMNSYIN